MKIRAFHIDGFGIYHAQGVSGLDPRLAVFLGENEAGKSTLLAFIRAILFGFPRANSRDPSYPPLAGGLHGGRLELVSDGGRHYTVERKPGKGGGTITVSSDESLADSAEPLRHLLGGITYEAFRNIYAFSLNELQTIDTLREEHVRSVIYGASTGAAILALPRAEKMIGERLDRLFRAGGKKPLINRKLAELKEITAKVRAASLEASRYDERSAELRDVEERILSSRRAIAASAAEKQRVEGYSRVWPEFLRLQEEQAKLHALPEKIESFPVESVSDLEGEEVRREGLGKDLEVLRRKADLLGEKLEGMVVNSALLGAGDAVRRLFSDRKDFVEAQRELPVMKKERESLQKEIDGLITGLGTGWTEERLAAMDRSLFSREMIRTREEEIARIEKELAAAEEVVRDREDQFASAAVEESAAAELLGRIGEAPAEDEVEAVTKIQQGRNEFASGVRDLPRRRQELRHERSLLEQMLREIDPRWTEAEAGALDVSLGARVAVEEFGQRLGDLRNEVKEAESLRRTLAEEVGKLRSRRLEASQRAGDTTGEPAPSGDEIAAKRMAHRTLLELSFRRRELEVEVGRLQDRLTDRRGRGGGNRAAEIYRWLSAASVGLGLIWAAWLVALRREVTAWIAALAGAVAALLFALLRLSARPGGSGGVVARGTDDPATVKALGEASDELAATLGLMEEPALLIGLEGETPLDRLLAVGDDLTREMKACEDRRRLEEEVGRLELELENAEEAFAKADDALAEAQRREAVAREEWTGRLSKLHLAADLSPTAVLSIMSKAETVRRSMHGIKGLASRVEEIGETMAVYRAAAAVIPALSQLSRSDDQDFLAAVDIYLVSLTEERRKRDEWRSARQDLEAKRRYRSKAELALSEERESAGAVAERLERAITEWGVWLASHSLPANLSPKTAMEGLDYMDEGARKIVARDSIVREIEKRESSVSRYLAKVSALIAELDREMPERDMILPVVEGIFDEYDSEKEVARRKAQVADDLVEVRSQIESKKGALRQCEERIASLLAKAGARNAEDFRRRHDLYTRRGALVDAVEQAGKHLRSVCGEEDLEALTQRLALLSAEGIAKRQKELELRLADLEGELSDLQSRRAEIRQRIESLASSEDISRLRQEEESLRAELQSAAMDWSRYALTRYLFTRAKTQFEERQQPKVVREAGSFFRRITEGGYRELFAPIGEETIEVVGADGKRKQPEELSRGTAEQLYLAIRFGYIRSRGENSESLPVVMDDILVNFDHRRLPRAAEAVLELADRQQVLFFTCHPETAALLSEMGGNLPVLRLHEGRFAGGEHRP
jgi:uncharacterized protein YhaN